MARKILMFYWNVCPNAMLMMPALMGLNMSGKYKIEMIETMKDEEGKKVFEKHKKMVKEQTGEDNASPFFVDVDEKKAILVQDFEGLMAWLEGEDWWKEL